MHVRFHILNCNKCLGNQAQKRRDFTRFLEEAKESSIDDKDVLCWRRYAQLTYDVFRSDTLEELHRTLGLKPQNVIAFEKTQQTMRPAYFICLDEETESVLMIFRGTKSFSDLITDLHCSSIRHKHGYCHKGILIAAQWFNNNRFIKQILHRTLELYPNYKLRLLGHSLGGGTAAILSTLWHDGEFPGVKSYAFACPPVLSLFLADECADYVTSFVNGDDFVTRLSMTAIEELRRDVSEYPWKEEMMRDIQNSTIVKFATGVKSYASGIFSRSVGLFKSGAAYYSGTTTMDTTGASINSDEIVAAVVDTKVVAAVVDTTVPTMIPTTDTETLAQNRKDDQYKEIYPSLPLDEKELDEVSFSEDSSPSSFVDVSFPPTDADTSSESSSPIKTPTKRRKRSKGKKRDQEQNKAHFIINDYENLVVSLFPAGKIYQIRAIDGQVYIKRARQEEYTKIILSESWKEDHRMIHYQNNLLAFPIGKELAVHESTQEDNVPSTPTGSDFVHLSTQE
jgi:hypothetical protein